MEKSEIAASLLGVEKAFVYQGRIARTVRDIGDMNQVAISGVLVSPEDQEYNDEGRWERIDCDIIIVPKKRYTIEKERGLRLDQVAMVLSDDSYWKEIK